MGGKHFASLYGEAGCEELLKFYNEEKYTDITVNKNKATVEEIKESLGGEIHIENGLSLRLSGSKNPELLSGFSTGKFFVQDSASATAVCALAPKRGDRVIDVCSCPGGKSCAAAALMGNRGEIFCFDIHDSKLSLVKEGAERLGISILSAAECDALSPKEELFATADKVICDAPCSGLGVLSKKPDLRYKDEESVSKLPELQLSILSASSRYLKTGGELLYSTCTLNPAEDEEVVRKFLEENRGFSLTEFKVGGLASDGGMLTLVPYIHKTDGFFMAKLKKDF